SDIEILEKIGTGAMGEIHRAKFRDGEAAVKQCKLTKSLKLFGVIDENYQLVLKYAPNGDLSQYLKVNKVDWVSKAKICHGIARGVMHCHKNDVYHFDLKPENILLDKDFIPKLADFGLSNSKSRFELSGGKAGGTLNWVAPERISSDAKMCEFFEKHPKLSDVYSFGLILWSVAMDGEMPYKELSDDKIKQQKCDKKTMSRLLKNLPEGIPNRYTQLISDLTKYEPKERCQLPSALLELEHVFKYYNAIEDNDKAKLQVINYSSSTISQSSGNANFSHDSKYGHHAEPIEDFP
ncbi:22656_t:CDS:2, partial [Racocetra persica]